MIRFNVANGQLEFENERLTAELLKHQQQVEAEAQANAVMLSVVYRVDGEPDEAVPFGGLLTRRLQLSKRTLREHLTEGRLGYFLGAKKAYRVSERDVRRFEAGLPPLASAA